MKKIPILLAFIVATAVITGFPSPASAQSVGTFRCNKQPGADRNISIDVSAGKNNEILDGLFFSAFSYANLGERLRCDPLIVGNLNDQGIATTASVYRFMQTLVNAAVLVILIAIAFANILKIKLDTYAVKKSVPLLVFGVIMANFSLPIIRTIVDFSGVLTATFIGETSLAGTKSEFAKQIIDTVFVGGLSTLNNSLSNIQNASGGFASVPWVAVLGLLGITGFATLAIGPFLVGLLFICMFILLIPAIQFFYLGLLFIMRIYVIVLLTAVSPVAFASLGYEPLKGKLWGWWWKKFIAWTFMAPATFAMIWLSVQFYRISGGHMDIGTYIVTVILIGAAAKVPFNMGGDWMTKWSKAVADPIRKMLSSPITAAQNYVQKAAPRDVSRGLSARGLNFAKPIKAVTDELERRAAQRESTSASVNLGRKLSTLTFDRTRRSTQGLLGGRLQFQTGKFERDADFEAARAYSDQILNDFGPNATYTAMDSAERSELARKTQEAVRSGDANRTIGAYFANARAGNYMNDKEHEDILSMLEAQGVNRENIARRYNRIILDQNKRRYNIAIPTPGTDPESAKTDYLNQLYSQLDAISPTEYQKDVLPELLHQLTDPNTHGLIDINELENNTTLFGIANAILRHSDKAGSFTSNAIYAGLNSYRARLGAATVSDVTSSTSVVPRGVRLDDLQPLFTPGNITGPRWQNFSTDQRKAIFQVLTDNTRTGNLKTELEKYADKLIKAMPASHWAHSPTSKTDIQKLIVDSIDKAHPAKEPNLIKKDDIRAAVKDDVVAQDIIVELRTLNAALGNIIEFKKAHASGKIKP